jgi:hypothetical protein
MHLSYGVGLGLVWTISIVEDKNYETINIFYLKYIKK